MDGRTLSDRAPRPRWRATSRCASVAALLLCCGCAASRPGTTAVHEVRGFWATVTAGESLQDLARKHHVPLEELEELNGLDRRDALQPGGRVFIPAVRRRPAAPPPAQREGLREVGGEPLIWPVPGGTLSSHFGKRAGRPHEGIDIAAKDGDPVVAAADGRVLYAGSGIKGYGNLVMLRHAGQMVTIYAHNRLNHVQEGQLVRRGQVIAEVGRSGRATGSHCHFEVRHGETPLDPLLYVSPPAR